MIRDKLLEPYTFLLNYTVLIVLQDGKTLSSITGATDDPITIQWVISNLCLNFEGHRIKQKHMNREGDFQEDSVQKRFRDSERAEPIIRIHFIIYVTVTGQILKGENKEVELLKIV